MGIDTATDVLAVALTEDKNLICEIRTNIKRVHAERLLPTINKVLCEADIKVKNLDGIAISIGPGSYTGLRIGLAVTKGLAYAANVPVLAISTLDAFAMQARYYPYQICPLIKSQADEAYTAVYYFQNGCLIRKNEYQLINLFSLNKLIKEKTLVINMGIKKIQQYISDDSKSNIELATNEYSIASGLSVSILGFEKLITGQSEDINKLEPFYLKNFKIKKNL